MSEKKPKKSKRKLVVRIILGLVLIGLLIGGWIGWDYYDRIYSPNVCMNEGHEDGGLFIYIPSGASQQDVFDLFAKKEWLCDDASFQWVAEQKNYQGSNIVPGKYQVSPSMSNNELIDHLRAGNGRLEVDVTFNNIRTVEQLAGQIGSQIEADSLSLISWLQNPDSISKFGFNDRTILTMFLPNTYKMDWAMTAPVFMRRMAKEYKSFWNDERKAKARDIGLEQSEVATLASIVQAEQQAHPEERPRIAGLYINRLKKGMLLQSDPTVIYGIGDFTITRVLNKHLEHDSPYNTYMHPGLPPGPINLPAISSLEAVLDYEEHDYIYMCAKPETGGLHNFAETYKQHLVYANIYWDWMNGR